MKKKRTLLIVIPIIILLAALAIFFARPKAVKKIVQRPRPKVAIVIDDWGYSLDCLNSLRQINQPLTLTVLPNLKYSAHIAKTAHSLNKEVLLHLPLEPERGLKEIKLEENTITSGMNASKIIEILESDLASVVYASGVSNHMGSRATKDSAVMSVILGELKKKDLFFLDAIVTDKSVGQKLAARMKVRFAQRDVFLDNLDDPEYIKKQFNQLAQTAQELGQAIGIGHARPATMNLLKSEIAALQAKGIELVFVSELVK